MTIFYFTSTGNNLYVAQQLGENCVNIAKAMREEQFHYEDDQIGFVIPVYGLCVPPIVEEFIEKVTLKCNYTFAILTYGFCAGAAATHLQEISERGKVVFDYIRNLKMVENYLPGFEMEKEKKKVNKTKELGEIQTINQEIMERVKKKKKDSFIMKALTKSHLKDYPYKKGQGYTKQYQVQASCKGCGTCSKLCPTQNIQIVNGKPAFKNQCISCLACIQNCPNNSILLEGEKSQARYRNPAISLIDLIQSNQ